MEKEFVTYEQALALKELGFDEPCFTHYLKKILLNNLVTVDTINSKFDNSRCSAPLYQQAFRWFREKYDLPSHIHTIWQYDWNNYSYQWHITENKEEWNCIEHFKTYEEAESTCLDKLIELVRKAK